MTAVPDLEPWESRRTRRAGALIRNSASPPLPFSDQFAQVEAYAQEIAMVGSRYNE